MWQNLRSGAKLAFSFTSGAHFRISYPQFWLLMVFGIALDIAGEYLLVPAPRIFEYYAIQREALCITSLLFTSFLISRMYRDEALALVIPVRAQSGMLVLALLSFALLAAITALLHFSPAFLKNYALYWSYLRYLNYVLYVWCFIVIFKAIPYRKERHGRRFAGACLLMFVMMYLPEKYFSHERFWTRDYSAEEAQHPKVQAYEEDVLQGQHVLLDRKFKDIVPRNASVNLYAIAFGSDSEQDVFMKEALYAQQVLEEKFHTKGHALTLINNPKTYADTPLATVTNLEDSVRFLARKAHKKKDILLIFLTSHGSANGKLYIEFDDYGLRQLDGENLKKILDESRFRYRIVIVSSCYSGKFLKPLQDNNTLIITASASDKTSFGCSDDAELTAFGDAYFHYALHQTSSFVEAYNLAKKNIEESEKKDGREASDPQISAGKSIVAYLKKLPSTR